jgi:hypothetical protein
LAGGNPEVLTAYRVAVVSTTAAIVLGAAIGLVVGIVVSVITDIPLAPEVGLLLGGVGGWLSHRKPT